ncbi:hypothetical protein J6590_039662 [Homalodisca vitripennis]|nr:hypothetical protein J6590_039662 [Homalodisca vitripennis]
MDRNNTRLLVLTRVWGGERAARRRARRRATPPPSPPHYARTKAFNIFVLGTKQKGAEA